MVSFLLIPLFLDLNLIQFLQFDVFLLLEVLKTPRVHRMHFILQDPSEIIDKW